MTSGNFHSVTLSDIIINREERQRRELTDIPSLADSLARLGLINPVVITRDFILVAGERRIAAARSLGWTHIAIQYVDELDPAHLRSIELEENIKRQVLPWKDECLAIAEFHELKKAEDPGWEMKDTAAAIGLDKSNVFKRLAVVKEIKAGNPLVLKAAEFSTARGIVERKTERDFQSLQETISPQTTSPILCADFNEWSKTYSGPKFNFIHCDFPYGIGADKFNQGAADTHGGYDDEEQVYWALCNSLGDFFDNGVAESCHFMFWFSMHFYHDTLTYFKRNLDIDLDPFPLVWTKSDNIGILPDPSRGPRRIYETAFFGSRGDRKVVRSKSNAIALPSERSTHMSIKPEPMLRHFFEMFVDANTVFLDPTCGSGSSVRAASALGARHVTGLEKNEEFARGAQLSFARKPNEKI